MREVQNLQSLYLKLSDDEKRLLKRNLQQKSDDESVGIQIVSFLERSRIEDLYELQKLLGIEISIDALRKHVDRLVDKIYDVLINKDIIINSQHYDQRAKAIFQLLRLMLISDVLTYRGISNMSDKLLSRVVKESRYYNHYDILVYALVKKLNRSMFNHDLIAEIEEDIRYNQNCSLVLNQIMNVHIKYMNAESIVHRSKSLKALPTEIQRFSELLLSYSSPLIRMYLYFVQMEYLTLSRHPLIGLNKAEELIDFLNENLGLFSNIRFANALLYKAQFLRLTFSFTTAVSIIDKAKKYLKDNPVSNFIVFEQLFICNYFLGDLPKSRYYLKALTDLDLKEFDSKVKYYSAALDFVGNPGLYKQQLEHSNDSVGSYVNIHVRVLNIISSIDSEKFDLAESQIENLRKYLGKNTFTGIVPPRIRLIMKILGLLSKSSFNFKKVVKSNQRLLSQFHDVECAWYPEMFDLIIVEEWLDSKAAGRVYNHLKVINDYKKKAFADKVNSIYYDLI